MKPDQAKRGRSIDNGTVQDQGLDIRRLLAVVLRRWWIFLLVPAVLMAGAYVLDRRDPRLYDSKVTLLVTQGQGASSGVPSLGNLDLSARLAQTYGRLITTRAVLDEVAQNLGLPFDGGGLQGKISTQAISNAQLLEVRVRDEDPAQAHAIATELANVFIDYIQTNQLSEIARIQGALASLGIGSSPELVAAQLAALGSLSIVEPASFPGSPIDTGLSSSLVIAFVLGFIIAGVIIVILESLDDTLKSVEEVQSAASSSVLGVIPEIRFQKNGSKGQSLVMNEDKAPSGESFRILSTNIRYSFTDKPGNLILVTSPGPAEGKSTILANLAVAMAQTGKRVVAVDVDLRHPRLSRLLATADSDGLSELLVSEDKSPQEFLRETSVPNLTVLPSGYTPPNPAELLSSHRLVNSLEILKRSFELVLLDSPPVLAVADPSIVAPLCDGVIVVVEQGRTRVRDLQATVKQLKDTHARLLGVVINLVKPRLGTYGYYGYYYRYSYYYGNNNRKGSSASRMRTGKDA